MKIRSITYFTDPGYPIQGDAMSKAGAFFKTARATFEIFEYEVQTVRMATPPFGDLVPPDESFELARLAQDLEAACGEIQCDYVSLGPARVENLEACAAIPEVLASTEVVFFGGLMTSAGAVSLPAVRACAEVIEKASTITPDGFANLRFAALANVPPGSPFFPAAYHDGGEAAFALALEAADLAVSAFENADSLASVRQNLVQAMQETAAALADTAEELALGLGLRFLGIDFSLAPFPEQARSLGAALERLGVPAVGLHGSLAAAAFLADTMDRAQFKRTGFSGLFLPVLEDAALAQRAGEGLLGVKDLLLYSAVCGTGLDTVPLPGNTGKDELTGLLLDVAALALRLNKPLTARLMPIPGKRAGQETGFDFEYFANSRVMALEAGRLGGLLAGEEAFELGVRKVDGSG